jgi:hypothetical protein
VSAVREHGRFVPGQRYGAATEFRPGHRLGVATRFRAGSPAHNHLPVGSVRVRVEANTGLPRAWVKVAEPNVWRKRAVVVWEAAHGPIPRGSVVHHCDRNSMNDALSNLVSLTRKEHADQHRGELYAARAMAAATAGGSP